MKKVLAFLFSFCFVFIQSNVFGQTDEADSVDVLHYDLTLDMGKTVDRQLRATAEITLRITKPCRSLTLDLICDTLHPISLNGVVIRGFDYDRDNARLQVSLPDVREGDTILLRVPYVSNGHVERYGFGGLHMDSDIYYNLGVAFEAHPHVFGRSWFPCRDNFYDKATYRFTVTTKSGWRAVCGGDRISEVVHPDGSTTSVWYLGYPIPTYLASVSAADFRIIERQYDGLYGTYPAILGFSSQDSAAVAKSFDMLDTVLPMYERCFGPYRFGRIGYIATPRGSMEHTNNIGLVADCMTGGSSSCRMVICHELSHAWFGNLVTCSNEGDMWINEGGATFCEEVACEALLGKEGADDYYQAKLATVLRQTHIADAGWRALSGMSPHYTYGSTSYDKGGLVWHSLRGYLGDSLFYSSVSRLFSNGAFGAFDAARLRDSLSRYSGADLTDFFDFHIFQPGFVDYAVEGLSVAGNDATLTVRQLLLGTDRYARGNRVPVTFFSSDLRRSDQLMCFDDSVATQTFSLPFEAAFAVVDLHHQISDACTDDTVSLASRGLQSLGNSYCRVRVGAATAHRHAWVHVGHHSARPAGDIGDGVVRIANRYWRVSGNVPWDGDVEGQFFYNQGTNGAAGTAFLDNGFYDRRSTLDSLCLMYRASPQHPWQVVSRTRTASSTASNGYFTARLFPGEYVLAVVDSNRVGISPAAASVRPTLRIVPNPSTEKQFRIDLGRYEGRFNLSVVDSAGKKVLERNGLCSGDTVRHRLPAGAYVVLIQNNFISLHSQIIVQ